MIKTQPIEWVQIEIPHNRWKEEKEWSQWLLFYGASYVFGYDSLLIQDPDIALIFKLTFGI